MAPAKGEGGGGKRRRAARRQEGRGTEATYFGDDDTTESVGYASIHADEVELEGGRAERVEGHAKVAVELVEVPVI